MIHTKEHDLKTEQCTGADPRTETSAMMIFNTYDIYLYSCLYYFMYSRFTFFYSLNTF